MQAALPVLPLSKLRKVAALEGLLDRISHPTQLLWHPRFKVPRPATDEKYPRGDALIIRMAIVAF